MPSADTRLPLACVAVPAELAEVHRNATARSAAQLSRLCLHMVEACQGSYQCNSWAIWCVSLDVLGQVRWLSGTAHAAVAGIDSAELWHAARIARFVYLRRRPPWLLMACTAQLHRKLIRTTCSGLMPQAVLKCQAPSIWHLRLLLHRSVSLRVSLDSPFAVSSIGHQRHLGSEWRFYQSG
jgi:hypothetical protein